MPTDQFSEVDMMGDLVMYITIFVGLLVGLGFLFKLYLQASRGVCMSSTDLTGKTVIITGPTAGIGVCTALDMATRNARLVLACRNVSKGTALRQRLLQETGNTNVVVYELDVSSMMSVRKFVKKFTQEETRCDILINNAGITGLMTKQTTDEGLESVYATNLFGPFLLTNLLLGILRRSAPSRIVSVSSLAHIWGSIKLDNLNSEKCYSPATVYGSSKLGLIMVMQELSRRLEGSGVTSNCLHPGTCYTNLFMQMPAIIKIPSYSIAYLFFKSAEEGAQTTIYCAVSADVETVTGRYFSECAVSSESKRAHDKKLARQLWEKCELITGLNETT